MFHVRTMSQADFDFAVKITDRMGWNLSVADFEFMVELEPEGCFVLFEDSKRIGLAATVNYGPVAWFGNLIVDENYRNKGAGSMLVKHSVAHLANKNVKTIGLYAYMDRIHFYETLGFKYDSEFTVLKGKGSAQRLKSTARQAEKKDVGGIMELDSSCFGADRKKLIEPIILDLDNLCYVSVEGERIVGYVVAKVFGRRGEIGPLVCSKGQNGLAVSLLSAVLGRLEGYEALTYVPNKESELLSYLKTLGFTESFRVARMFRGTYINKDCICMAESLERG